MTYGKDQSKPLTIFDEPGAVLISIPEKGGDEKVCITASGKGWCTRKDVDITK